MQQPDDEDHVKEVYARFGLAVYCAQVLEHGLVNALVILDLIPNRRHLATSREQWGADVDAFMDRNFEVTMGRLLRKLHQVTQVPPNLEEQLKKALEDRNWLVHGYFRDRSDVFMSYAGREQMLQEIDDCRDRLVAADRRLEEITTPIRQRAGITDDVLEREYRRMLVESRRDA
jgi:hypothetical protein